MTKEIIIIFLHALPCTLEWSFCLSNWQIGSFAGENFQSQVLTLLTDCQEIQLALRRMMKNKLLSTDSKFDL